MKYIIALLPALFLSQISAATTPLNKFALLCTGENFLYENWKRVSTEDSRDQITVFIDKNKSTISYGMNHSPRITADLIETEEIYSGSYRVNAPIMGMNVISIDFNINRFTGESFGIYKTDTNGNGKAGFIGKCVPARPRF